MAYKARYINPLIQFGKANYTLVIEEVGVPDVFVHRQDKKFPDSVSDADLEKEAEKELDRWLKDQSKSTEKPVSVKIDKKL